jgi:CheY-like chemotaxis protein
MSHELRSPLNGIIGFTELLYDGKLGPIPDKPREFLNRIHRSARHLLQFINGVLDLSKVEAGRLELQRERVRLSNTIQEVTASLAALAGEKRIRIEIEVDPNVDSVITDVGRLKQILYNYLSNALKFTGEGGRVKVRLEPEGTAEFRLEVADTGIGIAAKDIPRLFTEFQQLDSTAAKRYQGTGLGLALTKRIVEAQGGRVGVESCPGEGSTFYAVLPRQSRASATAPHILVIEDDKLQGLILARMLQNAGYEVETAATSTEAVAKCRERRFDAITLDLLLPDGSGDQALAQIRSLQNYRETPVIVVSVIDRKDVAISYGIQGFLTKPVGQKELVAALEHSGIAMEREGVA